jgi:hypothetical protein
MKTRILRIAAVAVTALGFAAPSLAAAHSGSIDTTGPNSNNDIRLDVRRDVDVDTHNRVDLRNDVDQHARSGDATLHGNTTGGDVSTGVALNEQEAEAMVEVSTDNSGATAWTGGSAAFTGSIGTTGPSSDNTIRYNNTSNVDVYTHNDVDIDSDVDQHAYSGDAHATNNTTVGDVTTGDAANYSTNSFSVSVSTTN